MSKLQEDQEGEDCGRDAGSSTFLMVELGKALIFEEPGGRVSKLGMEGSGIELEVVDVANIE